MHLKRGEDMYSTITNHVFQFTHFLISFVLLYIIYPRFFLFTKRDNFLDYTVENFLKMMLLTIVIGYVLVLLKLYEFLALIMVFIALSAYVYVYRKSIEEAKAIKNKWGAYIFNALDGVASLKEDFSNYLSEKTEETKTQYVKRTRDKTLVAEVTIITVILIYSAYLRFYDTFYYAAPPMSDGSVVLEWMKFIIQRKFFAKEIYPQGFHITLANIQKFAFIDPLYVLKYAGPLNGVLTTLGIYFFVSRIFKEKTPAFIAAITFGILGSYLPMDWMRQAASNSQEFGYVFIFPTVCYFYKYFISGEKKDLIVAFTGAAVIGLVHPIAYVFVALAVAILCFVAILIGFKQNILNVGKVILAGVFSGIIAGSPLVLGLLMKKKFHGSSQEFLTERLNIIQYPALKITDAIALASIFLLFIFILFNIKQVNKYFAQVYVLLLSSISFAIYNFGGVVTQSAVIATRFPDLWNLTSTVALGSAIHVILKIIKNQHYKRAVGVLITTAVLLICLIYIKPQPIVTYKMERNEEVEQYLRISSMCNPTQWTIVSDRDGDYSQILGRGTHIRTNEFVEKYSPYSTYIYYDGSDYKVPDVFIYHDKKPFPFGAVEGSIEERKIAIERRIAANERLTTWLEEYKKSHKNLTLFYEDENFEIYHIQQEITRDETLKKIFNE